MRIKYYNSKKSLLKSKKVLAKVKKYFYSLFRRAEVLDQHEKHNNPVPPATIEQQRQG